MTVTNPQHVRGASRAKGPGIQSWNISPALIQYNEVLITSASLLTLNATPVTLVPAPPNGHVIEFLGAIGILDYGTATYASNGIVTVRYTNGSGTALSEDIPLASWLGAASDTIITIPVLDADDGTALTANAALVLHAATGEMTTGNGVARVKTSYRVHQTGL